MSSSQPSTMPPASRTLARGLVPVLLLFVCLFATAASAQATVTQWTIRTVPTVGNQGRILGLSCISATSCIGVGWKKESSFSSPASLAAFWNGEKWTLQTVPAPEASTSAELTSVSCTSASACTAAGTYTPIASGKKTPFAERWNGTSWTVQTMPVPLQSEEAVLNGVSCPLATACVAVGVIQYGLFRPFVERWNGTAWTLEELKAPETPVGWSGAEFVTFAGVSCTAAYACTAVGSYRQLGGSTKLFAERWNGSAWTAQLPPAPEKALEPKLESVSCSSATACTATGNSKNASGVGSPLAEKWDGTSWAIQTTPSPTGEHKGTSLAGVSCPVGTTVCESVGSYQPTYSTNTPFAERFESSAWSLDPPFKSEAPEAVFRAVSCPTSSYCMVTGYAGSQPFTQTAGRVSKAPVMTGSPAVTPTTPKTGSPATTTNGKWNEEPTSFTYQWQRCTLECVNIAGATSSTYTPVAADLGNRLRTLVTATNIIGSTLGISALYGPVIEGP